MNSNSVVPEEIDSASGRSLDRVFLWLFTLLFPCVVTMSSYSSVNIIAPMWMFGFAGGTSVFAGFGFYITPTWSGFVGFSYLVALIYITCPVVLATVMLDFFPRGVGKSVYARITIFAYPILVLCFEALLLLRGADVLLVPFPLATIVQDIRYRQLRQTPSTTVSAVTETTDIV